MAGAKVDSLQSINVQLNGQNYSYWHYVMKIFLKGKRMWGYVSGTSTKPKDDKDESFAEQFDLWDAKNSKIITWVNNSVQQSIDIQLEKYETAKEVWEHLERLYTQSNFAKQYQLEIDIQALQQNSMNVQEFYSTMFNLWDQLTLNESAELQAFSPYIAQRDAQRLVQFLMALRDEFEGLRGTILHHSPLPLVDSVVNELLAEEMRLKSRVYKQAMAKELSALYKTHTWYIFPLPVGKRAIGSRWVYKIKTKYDGSVERYKACLVAKV
ncbi:uncharacterized protein LOC133805845 [Humulus lupulus]|uniref:uncharacterized protein LOC133805845 n=1 Tax=Humulus lupulus TaxID=3486 RepID=UPI002B40376D|nr:uncharacterized protein LOC133805845 [Humulus lupulus]